MLKIKRNISYRSVFVMLSIIVISILMIWKFEFKNIQLIALSILILNVYIIYKVRNNSYLLLLNLPMMYFTYGIVVGEYLARNKQPVFNSLRSFNNGQYYNSALIMLFIFMLVYSVFLKTKDSECENYFEFRNNNIIFIGIYMLLIYIAIFCINRVMGDSYSVKVTPMYEYSYVLFIFLIRYTGNEKLKKILVLVLAIVFIIQDFYYGGRITSIQISLVILSSLYIDKLNLKNLIIGIIIAVLIMYMVSAYRNSYSLEDVSVINILKNLKEELFVDSTAVYAYSSSITHIAGSEYFSVTDKLKSVLGFLINIFIGGNSELAKMGNVTTLVGSVYTNIGGGIIFSHFYFWLGWIGIILGAVIVTLISNKLVYGKSELSHIMLVGFISAMPRWYLYSPLSLFRSTLLFIPLIYFLCKVAEKFFKGVS